MNLAVGGLGTLECLSPKQKSNPPALFWSKKRPLGKRAVGPNRACPYDPPTQGYFYRKIREGENKNRSGRTQLSKWWIYFVFREGFKGFENLNPAESQESPNKFIVFLVSGVK